MAEPRKPTPGYPEKNPGDKGEAQKPDPKKPCNPDEGGMRRDPEPDTPAT